MQSNSLSQKFGSSKPDAGTKRSLRSDASPVRPGRPETHGLAVALHFVGRKTKRIPHAHAQPAPKSPLRGPWDGPFMSSTAAKGDDTRSTLYLDSAGLCYDRLDSTPADSIPDTPAKGAASDLSTDVESVNGNPVRDLEVLLGIHSPHRGNSVAGQPKPPKSVTQQHAPRFSSRSLRKMDKHNFQPSGRGNNV